MLAKRPNAVLYELLAQHRLPGKTDWSFRTQDTRHYPGLLVDTVARFKGLESSVVILWLGEEVVNAEEAETASVGTSRGKYLMHVVGSAKACAGLVPKSRTDH